jgi:hypothetical protein
MELVHTDFARAFQSGATFESQVLGSIFVRPLEAAQLILTSGRIIACEPSFLQGQEIPPFTRTVPPGRYPVVLSLARFTNPHGSDERVACAMIRFRTQQPRTWEMALRPGQELATLRPGHYFGYGIDGGRGGFLDADVQDALAGERDLYRKRLLQRGREKRPLYGIEQIVDTFSPFFRQLWETRWRDMGWPPSMVLTPSAAVGKPRDFPLCIDLVAVPETGANVVEFSSGWGDGCYASYWGLGDDGALCCLVTDFGLLVEGLQGSAEFLLRDCLDGVPSHPDLQRLGLSVRVRLEVGPPLSVFVEYANGECAARLINGIHEAHGGYTSGDDDHGSRCFRLDEPLRDDAKLILTYSLGARAL